MWVTQLDHVEDLSGGGQGYSAVHFACAAVHLLDSKHHVVRLREMQLLLGRLSARGSTCGEESAKEAGKTVLQSMVRANALSIRPYSNWALDIPLAAYLSDDQSPVVAPGATAQAQQPIPNIHTIVTAPSASDLYCMGRLRSQLEMTLESFGKVQVGSKIFLATPSTYQSLKLQSTYFTCQQNILSLCPPAIIFVCLSGCCCHC